MKGSLKLFTLFGIPVHLHWTFSLLLLYAFYLGLKENGGLFSIFLIIGLFTAVFGCVLLHEFGHSLTARRYGVDTQDIILTPIGGIARLEKMPEKPTQEFWVAIAGPAVNVGIALVIFLFGMLIYDSNSWELFKALSTDQFRGEGNEQAPIVASETGIAPSGFLYFLPILASVNIWLVLFNLIPAFPMDGGRIFRSLLAMRLGRSRATKIASIVGQIIAAGFIAYGIWVGPITLVLIGLFVFSTARTENAMVQTDAMLKKYAAKDLMRPNFTRLTTSDWMQTPIEILRQGGQERNFLVFNFADQLVGVLEEEQIIEAMKKQDFSAPVEQFMQTDLVAVAPGEPLRNIFQAFRYKGHRILPVVADNQILGVIDEAGLSYFLRLQSEVG